VNRTAEERGIYVVTSDLPEPPYPADTKANGYKPEVDWQRIKASKTWRLCPVGQRNNLLRLWTESWNEVPAGSWESDDELIAAAIDVPLEEFRGYRSALMRGWQLHSDDRLYHPFITSQVEEMLRRRTSSAHRVRAWRERKEREKEASKADVTRYKQDVTRYKADVTRNQRVSNAQEQEQEQEQEQDIEEKKPPLSPLPEKREAWTPPEWVNPQAWADFELHRREIRKPLSDLARTKAANQLQGMTAQQQQACIDASIQARWSGIFPDKHRGNCDAARKDVRTEGRTERAIRIQQELEERARQSWANEGGMD
jgi:hypothetical protein